MTVKSKTVVFMVDNLQVWTTRRPFHRGSCHLTVDPFDALEELHAFAAKIGLKREWFQGSAIPHYDLTPSRRAAALLAGAKFVGALEQARMRRAKGIVFGRRQT